MTDVEWRRGATDEWIDARIARLTADLEDTIRERERRLAGEAGGRDRAA